MRALAILLLLMLPGVVVAQDLPDPRVGALGPLLEIPEVDSLLVSLPRAFLQHFGLLVPDLGAEDLAFLTEAAHAAFEPAAVREEIAEGMASNLGDDAIAFAADAAAVGPIGELRRAASAHQPQQSFAEFGRDLAGLDRERLQLMVALAEASRSSELALLLEESTRQLAHSLVGALGGEAPPFQPMSDESFDATYRDRTLTDALRLMYRLESVPSGAVEAALAVYRSEPHEQYTDAYVLGVLSAVASAGQRVADLTVVAEEEPVGTDPAASPLCMVEVCGFQVEWEGSEPSEYSPAYEASGDLQRYVLQDLVSIGYLVTLGPVDDGLTIHLRPRAMRALCEVMSGTDNRSCMAVGQVRVEFRGVYPGHETPGGFMLRNRCGADSYLGGRGISSLLAARIHYSLTTHPGDERRVPDC